MKHMRRHEITILDLDDTTTMVLAASNFDGVSKRLKMLFNPTDDDQIIYEITRWEAREEDVIVRMEDIRDAIEAYNRI